MNSLASPLRPRELSRASKAFICPPGHRASYRLVLSGMDLLWVSPQGATASPWKCIIQNDRTYLSQMLFTRSCNHTRLHTSICKHTRTFREHRRVSWEMIRDVYNNSTLWQKVLLTHSLAACPEGDDNSRNNNNTWTSSQEMSRPRIRREAHKTICRSCVLPSM